MANNRHTDIPEVTDDLYNIKVHRLHLAMSGIRIHKLSDDRQQIPKVVFRYNVMQPSY
jgi:hypothetical protein